MRWDDLFADLEGRFDELAYAAEEAELADRTRVEFGRVTAVERLVGAIGGHVRLRLAGGQLAEGRLNRVGTDWVLLRESGSAELLIALAAVAAVEGLAACTGAELGSVDARFDLRKALRSVARDRAPVTVHSRHGTELSGTIDRVGHDFVELAVHAAWEVRRSAAVRSVLLVPLAGLVMVRSVPLG